MTIINYSYNYNRRYKSSKIQIIYENATALFVTTGFYQVSLFVVVIVPFGTNDLLKFVSDVMVVKVF